MIETIILNHLKKEMDVPVYMEIPIKNIPKKYVLIERTGGGSENNIDSATMAIQSIAESLFSAAELNEEVKQKMNKAIALDEISKIRLNSDYNFTDVTTKKYRYQAVFEITYYKEV